MRTPSSSSPPSASTALRRRLTETPSARSSLEMAGWFTFSASASSSCVIARSRHSSANEYVRISWSRSAFARARASGVTLLSFLISLHFFTLTVSSLHRSALFRADSSRKQLGRGDCRQIPRIPLVARTLIATEEQDRLSARINMNNTRSLADSLIVEGAHRSAAKDLPQTAPEPRYTNAYRH
jgi:hypothetical protein